MPLKRRIITYFFALLFSTGFITAQTTQYEIKKISFQGNSALTSLQIYDACYSKESPGWLSQFIFKFTPFGAKAVYFDSLNIPLDTKFIKELYISNGYFNVQIAPSYKLDKEKRTAEIFFDIKEGNPFYIRNFRITGLERLPVDLQSQLQGKLDIDTSNIFSRALVIDKKEYVLSFLNNNGFADAQVQQPTVAIDTLRKKVDVSLDFVTGNRFKISEIKIEKSGTGKDLIDDSLIKEICGIKPDTYFNQYENTKAYLRLWRTQLFDSLALNKGSSDINSNLVPLEIIGKVTPLHELSPELIGNNEDDELNLGLALSFIKKNFLGDARKLGLTGTAATKNFTQIAYTDIRLSLEQPYLFGSQIRPRFETYFTNQIWKGSYDAIFYGAKINLDFESDLTPYTFITSLSTYINWEYSKYIYEKKYLEDKFSYVDPEVLQRFNFGDRREFSGDNATIGILMAHEKVNKNPFPTKGVAMSLLLEDGNSVLFLLNKVFSNTFSRPLYLKSLFSFSNYYPLWEPEMTTFAYKIKAGSIINYRGDKLDIPVNYRFYGGGSNSIRGWKSRDLVPASPAFEIGPNTTNEDFEALIKKVSPGGFLLLEGSFEMRNRWGEYFVTAVFLDYGNTWNELPEISLKSVAVSAGLGFRIYTPFVPPIRFDFGFKIYDPYKQKLDINKSIGDLFKENFEIQFGFGEAF